MGFFKKVAKFSNPVTAVGAGIQKLTGLSQGKQLAIGAGVGAGAGVLGMLRGGGAGPTSAADAGADGGSGSSFGAQMLGNAVPGVIGAGADIWSANKMAEGQSAANQTNLESAREQMAFQERMSSTAHQREVADLRAAGLNPVLSANSGASTPVGATQPVSNAAPDYSGIGSRAVGSALQVAQMKKDFQEADSRIAMNKASASRTRSEKLGTDIDNNRNFWDLQWDVDNPRKYWFKRMFQSMTPAAATARDAAIITGGAAAGLRALSPSNQSGRTLELYKPTKRETLDYDSYRRK